MSVLVSEIKSKEEEEEVFGAVVTGVNQLETVIHCQLLELK